MESDWQTILPLELKNTSSQVLAHGLSVSEPPSLQLKDVGVFSCYRHIVIPVGTTSDQNYYPCYMLIKDMNLKTLKLLQPCLCWTKKAWNLITINSSFVFGPGEGETAL